MENEEKKDNTATPEESANKTAVKRHEFHDEKGNFKPGNNANPLGRPKGAFSIRDEVRKRMKMVDPKDPHGRTYGEIFVDSMMEKALNKGHFLTAQMLWEQIEGKPKQTIDQNIHDKSITDLIRETYDDEGNPRQVEEASGAIHSGDVAGGDAMEQPGGDSTGDSQPPQSNG